MSEKVRIAPAYLIYGDNVPAMQQARDRVLDALLTPAERIGNLTEYIGTGNKFGVELTRILGDINADLSTLSFIADARKVAVVTDPVEIFENKFTASRRKAGKSKKKNKAAADDSGTEDATPPYVKWIEKTLPKTGNHIIFIAHTDPSEGREVGAENPLFQAIGQIHGEFMPFVEQSKIYFHIEDALIERRPDVFFEKLAEVWNPGKTDGRIYNSVVKVVRFMLQAGILRDPRVGRDPARLELLLPASSAANVTKAHEFVMKKYTARPPAYRMADLIKTYHELLEVWQAMRPRPGQLHVPDARQTLERVLARLFASPPPGRR